MVKAKILHLKKKDFSLSLTYDMLYDVYDTTGAVLVH